MPRNILSVLPVPGGFAVAIDKVATGEIYTKKETCQKRVDDLKAERKAASEVSKEAIKE